MNKVANLLLDWKQKNVKKSDAFEINDIKDVLILTDQKLPELVFNTFEKPTVLFYSETKDLPRGSIPVYKSDFSLFGKIKSNQIRDILDKNYDLFIENHSEKNPFLDYIYRLIKAKCKISSRHYKWVDIEIQNQEHNSESYFQDINTVLDKFK